MKCLFLSLAVLLALAAVPSAHATFPGKNGRIAAAANGDSFRAIITLPATGQGRGRGVRFVRDCQLDESGQPESGDCEIGYTSPAWAATGRRLVFDAGLNIAVIEPDGTAFRTLSSRNSTAGEPAESPSGNSVAFTATIDGQRDLLTASVLNAGTRVIVRGARAPDWSIRNRIAFERDGTIFSVNGRGGDLRRIARGRAPSWGPTGRTIAFARRNGIYVARADGTRVKRAVRCSGCRTPAISPDGRLVVYKQRGLVVARLSDGRRLRRLIEDAPGSFSVSQPSWQPR